MLSSSIPKLSITLYHFLDILIFFSLFVWFAVGISISPSIFIANILNVSIVCVLYITSFITLFSFRLLLLSLLTNSFVLIVPILLLLLSHLPNFLYYLSIIFG